MVSLSTGGGSSLPCLRFLDCEGVGAGAGMGALSVLEKAKENQVNR